MDLCDHVVVLDFGRRVAAGTPARFRPTTRSPPPTSVRDVPADLDPDIATASTHRRDVRASDDALLDVEGLSSGYGAVAVLHDIDLALEPATITVVLGANGAGKTTLLRSLSGLLRPSAGGVRFDGRDLVSVPVERLVTLGVAHVPEGRGVIAELTVEDNLRLGGLWRRGGTRRAQTRRGDRGGVRAVRAAGTAPRLPRPPALRR